MMQGFSGTVVHISKDHTDGFADSQVVELRQPLDIRNVKTRIVGGGMRLSYIEGQHAIRKANRIFGFGQWDRRLEDLTLTAEIEEEAGDGTRWRVSYLARVQILVQVPDAKENICREGVGAGHGISRYLGEAHEAAAKASETDAMKRALMTFGNQFGLGLHKQCQAEAEVEVDECNPPQPRESGTPLKGTGGLTGSPSVVA